jgi:hypothetical protein
MKAVLIFLLIFILSSKHFSQEICKSYFGLVNKSMVSHNNRITIGIGFKKSFNTDTENLLDDKSYLSVTSSVIFHIYKPVYLYTGIDIVKGKWKVVPVYLNVMPGYEFNIFKKKLLIQVSAGGTSVFYFGSNEGGILLGIAGMIRPEYRLNKRLSVAAEIKHFNFLKESTGELIFTGNVCFTYYY